MFRATHRVLYILCFPLLLNCVSFASTTTTTQYAVGTCKPNLQSYSTISQAVSSVPPNSTVLVCPGSYPEQVVINQPLTLKGILVGGSGQALVSASGGLTHSVLDSFNNNVYYQILVQNTTGPVNISDLAVDGTGANVSGGCTNYLVGIYYQESSGTVSSVSVRNQTTAVNGSCASGTGLRADGFTSTQTVSFLNSTIHGFDSEGILAGTRLTSPTLTVTIKGNDVRATGNSAVGIGVGGASGTIQSNTVSDVQQALSISTTSLNITSNTLSSVATFGPGIYVDQGSNTIKSNKFDFGGQQGIIFYRNGSNFLQANTLVNSSTAVTACSGATGNTIGGNTILDANVGINIASGNTIQPNTFFVVATAVVPC